MVIYSVFCSESGVAWNGFGWEKHDDRVDQSPFAFEPNSHGVPPGTKAVFLIEQVGDFPSLKADRVVASVQMASPGMMVRGTHTVEGRPDIAVSLLGKSVNCEKYSHFAEQTRRVRELLALKPAAA